MKLNLSTFFQLKWNVVFFRKLPARICFAYMQAIGKLYYLFFRKEKQLIQQNIRDMLFDRPASYVRQITKEAFKGIFSHYYEKMFSAFKNIQQIRRYVEKRITIQNEDLIRTALERGKGVILVTAHWGAVEFIPWVLSLKNFPISVILECQTEHLKRALSKKAESIDAEMINCSENSSVFFEAIRSLKRNRLLMTECDEVDTWRKREGRTIDLFGKKLFYDNTLDILAKRTGAPVVGVFLKRVSKSSYTLICEPISTGDTAVNTAREALALWQKYVTQNPEQWYQWKKWGAMKVAS